MKLKVLFVCSGNNKAGINEAVKSQGDSLRALGTELNYFTISGRGIKSYLKHVSKLRGFVRERNFDVIHAHYSYSAITASLAGCRPLVVSLMGSDVMGSTFSRILARFFGKLRWDSIIVKSEGLKERLRINDCEVIPNGVNLEKFFPAEKARAREITKMDQGKRYVLFAANPARPEKNFELARDAVEDIMDEETELSVVYGLPSEQIPSYLNSADVVLLTSRYEGSANILKEALACNRPVVSTDTGDARLLLEGVDGCFISEPNAEDVARNIRKALRAGSSNGRSKIISAGLDSETVGRRILKVYKSVR